MFLQTRLRNIRHHFERSISANTARRRKLFSARFSVVGFHWLLEHFLIFLLSADVDRLRKMTFQKTTKKFIDTLFLPKRKRK